MESYFCIKTESGKCDKGFRREGYFPIENTEHIAVVHYIGNESLSGKDLHRKAKHGKLFFHTKAHKIYKGMVCENKDGQAVQNHEM